MKNNILMQIANGVSANVQKLTSPGLLEGKMGVAVFLYHYARYAGQTTYNHLADCLVDEIIESMEVSQVSCANGLSGIGWGIKYLMKAHFIKSDDEVLEELDNRIIAYIKCHADEDMLDGCIYLALCNPALLDDTLMKIMAEKGASFLSSTCQPLAVLNKLLKLAIHVPGAWDDKIPEAAQYAIKSQLYRRSDLKICKELLNVSNVKKGNKALDDMCTSRLTESDSHADRMEVVWQHLVFLGGAVNGKCPIDYISNMVTNILKDLSVQDMYFASGLPAMGMDILLTNQ